MLLFRAPGVYKPQSDSWLLIEALREATIPSGSRVLDIGTGTGIVSVAAAQFGPAEITAIDISVRAILTAWVNTTIRRLPVRVRQGDGLDRVAGRQFDVILANPPYVPGPLEVPPRGRARAWESGIDGRALLDRLCARAPELLAPGGFLMLVQSVLCGVEVTLHRLRERGLTTSVVARHVEPFGPVLRERVAHLRSRGLIEAGQRHEELVVIRADRPEARP